MNIIYETLFRISSTILDYYLYFKRYLLTFYPKIYINSINRNSNMDIYEYKVIDESKGKIHTYKFIDVGGNSPYNILEYDLYSNTPVFIKIKSGILYASISTKESEWDITEQIKEYSHYILNADKNKMITWNHLLKNIFKSNKIDNLKEYNVIITLDDLSEIIIHSDKVHLTIYEFIKKNN